MAENAAHITVSLHGKPSIFEVIAQESLNELLYPSFKIIIQFLGSSQSQSYLWLHDWYEEVFLLINGLLQLHYLNRKDASFSESFYGLRRGLSDGQISALSAKAKYWSLFCLVGLPYLTHKAEKCVLKLQNLRVGAAIDLGHRTIQAAWHTASFIQYLMYLTGHVRAHSPLLSAANLSLQYCPEQPKKAYSWSDCFSSPRACARQLSDGFTQGLELAAFFLQCLQWWHSDEHGHDKLSSFIPPPPPPLMNADQVGPGICPVCKEPCKVETVLSTSGYVFCYRCIREEVSTRQRCPVTGLPTTLEGLVRLYPSN